ncbi:PIN2/TERF1-interacting telomerase inhibitor 1-like isoform X2 [Dromaius novaehollandiae]|uniref:PIN2/TERF1-interacting telomerase inhibitor 1-like n=1 Tax=Dromaius novaehollandiae TaxID=8790 RepID=UPI00312005BC
MAMLAEPRRRQKWSVDPRNSAWSKDESKFGQKMLEKMGWSKGKGLGAQEQGNTEHIKVHVKNNMLGLGATINHEDSWIAHQDDFNQLLAELNDCHGQGETDHNIEEDLLLGCATTALVSLKSSQRDPQMPQPVSGRFREGGLRMTVNLHGKRGSTAQRWGKNL